MDPLLNNTISYAGNYTMQSNPNMTLNSTNETFDYHNISLIFSIDNHQNISNTTQPEVTSIPQSIITIIFVFNGILSLLGIIGNLFVCFIIVRGRKMYTIANLFLMNLAIADMCVLVISYPLWVLQSLEPNSWPFGSVLCKIIPTISDAFYGVSLGCMTTISIHRYRMILHAMGKQLTFPQSKMIITGIWFISLLTISVPLYPVLRYQELSPQGVVRCQSRWPSKTYEQCYQLFLLIFWYICPLLIILFTFIRIKLYLEKQMTYEWLQGSEHTLLIANHIMGIKKALRMLAPVVIVFAILMLPWNIIRLVSIFTEVHLVDNVHIYIMVSGTMLVANSVSNPFTYYIMSKEFRIEFQKQFWLLKVKLGIESNEHQKFTLESDKYGRTVVRRTASFLDTTSVADSKNGNFKRPRTATQSSDVLTPNISHRSPPSSIMNTYEPVDEIIRNAPQKNSTGGNGAYDLLRFTPPTLTPLNNNTTLIAELYSIEEENSTDLDSPECFVKNVTKLNGITETKFHAIIDSDDLKETRL
ncbi:QRFP-like peptide receptor [Clytia hemisphaerica]|uniref:QRFP-like peptide receptor n=1 Tax=Clytia hemisphaerica TaxID=252671 RepID=UPI0034D5F2D3